MKLEELSRCSQDRRWLNVRKFREIETIPAQPRRESVLTLIKEEGNGYGGGIAETKSRYSRSNQAEFNISLAEKVDELESAIRWVFLEFITIGKLSVCTDSHGLRF